MTPPQNSAEVAEAIGPTLDRFVLASAPMLRDCAEAVYEQLLYSVQDYLKANAEWNIGNEIDRCRKIEIENIELRATIHQLGENAAKAAGEYAEEVVALKSACDGWRVQFEMSRESLEVVRGRIGELEAMLNRVATALPVLETMLAVAGLNAGLAVAQELHAETRAALTEPTDEA